MAWYDTTNKGSIQSVGYDPSVVREKNSISEGNEIKNTDEKYKLQQKQNQDQAFSDSVEQKKIVDPVSGKITYSLYLDPDKYAAALFKISKSSGTSFNMDDAMAQAKYQTARMQTQTTQNIESQTQRAQGMKVEGEPNPTQQTPSTIKSGNIGEVRIGKDGVSYTFDGKGWHKTDETEGSF
jgi:hypothetical protein